MQVKLISHSQSDGSYLIDSASATELVAFCARVSNPDNQMNSETSEKLIKYLMKHCLLYTSPSPRDRQKSRMPSSA